MNIRIMNNRILASIIFGSALLSVSLPAVADWDGYHQDHGRWDRQDRHDRDRDDRRGWRDRADNDRWRDRAGNDRWHGQADNRGWYDNGWHGRKDYRPERVIVVQRDYVRGVPRPYYEWRRGQYLPASYRQRTYYVDNWRSYQLYEPPRGYRWVRVNGDYILVSIVSNVIAQILLGH